MRTRVEADPDVLKNLQLYVLCAPHLEIGGWHNSAEVLDTKAGRIIVAFKGDTWMALGATAPLVRRSCGYVAVNDGWTDLHDNRTLDWQYEAAYDGNIAVTAQIDLTPGEAFTLGLAFGDTRHRAITTLFQSLVTPFDATLQRFREEWNRTPAFCAGRRRAGSQALAALRTERESVAGPRGQELSRRHDCGAEHPVAAAKATRSWAGITWCGRAIGCRDRAARRRRSGDAAARARVSGRFAAG
jgi:hypothetical protein